MRTNHKVNVIRIVLLAVWCLSLFANVSLAAGSPEKLRELSPQELQNIESAVPAKATATPKQPRKILVFWLCKGYFHEAIPVGNKAFEMMGEKTGAYETVISNDMAMFEANKLKDFDVVLLNNTTKLPFDNPEHHKALMDFVKSGKGVVGIHAATDNFYDWPEAAEMMGALFDSHPWGAKGTWAVKLDEPKHPLNKAFDGKGFLITDEIYQFKDPYNRDKLRVLLSLDMSDERNLKIEDTGSSGKIHRKDNDFAITWVRGFGKGRVFYCSLGHNDAIFWNPAVLQHYLDGIQFALGDLVVDAKPAALSVEVIENMLSKIAGYDYGHSREPLTQISDFIGSARDCPELTKAVEQKFLKFLQSEASLAAKQFICKELAVIGTEAAVPTLAEMLTDEKTSDMARYALEQIPSAGVGEALRKALQKTTGKIRIGVINTLGVRGDRKAVTVLRGLMYDSDQATATAAVAAMGKIAGARAVEALAEAGRKTKGDLRLRVLDAHLKCADRLAEQKKNHIKALAIYKYLYNTEKNDNIRIAALTGIVNTSGGGAKDIVLEAIKSDNDLIQTAAISLIRQIPGVEIIKAAAGQLANLAPPQQVQMLSALADRGDTAALGEIVKATESSEGSVRIAALTALASLGDASTVDLLARTAATTGGEEQQAARDSLYLVRGPKVQQTITTAVAKAEPKVKIELIRSIEQRGIYTAAVILLKTAKDADNKVRVESIKVLRAIAEAKHLPALVDILINAQSGTERSEAERTVVAVSRKIAKPQHQADAVLAALPGVDDVKIRGSLLQVLGRIGGDRALAVLRKALDDKDPQLQLAAIRGLSNWPSIEPADDLLKVAQSRDSQIQRVLALRGFIGLTALDIEHPAKQIKMYKQAMVLASNANEKKMVLAGLANVASFDALQMAADYLDAIELREEAAASAVKIAGTISSDDAEQTKTIQRLMKKVIEISKSESLRRRAQRVVDRLEK